MEGLRSLMESIDGPRVVAVDMNFEDAVNAIRELQPSLLILDKGFGVPALTGWVRLLNTAGKPAPVIVWGTMMSEAETVRFLQAGAAGVIRKSAPLADLADCIRTVTAGGSWTRSQLAFESRPLLRTPRSMLTPRETQVADLVERGYKNREIGQSLGIRTGTVKIHLKHIFEKTGIRGRYGLALSGLKHKGLLAAAVPSALADTLHSVILMD
jgi:DNA-binding NarL/FixJ family response regulator